MLLLAHQIEILAVRIFSYVMHCNSMAGLSNTSEAHKILSFLCSFVGTDVLKGDPLGLLDITDEVKEREKKRNGRREK